MKGKIIIFIGIFILLSSSFSLAIDFSQIKSFEDFNRHIPEFNSYLENTPIILPSMILKIIHNDDVAIHVKMNEGYIESFVISIYENYITKIIAGPQPTKLYLELDETTINELISNPDLAMDYYKKGIIQIKSTSSLETAKLYVIKTLIKWFG